MVFSFKKSPRGKAYNNREGPPPEITPKGYLLAVLAKKRNLQSNI